MAELPLSKFAPFSKYECHFKPEVANKLKDINVQCAGCIYYNDNKRKVVGDTSSTLGELRSDYEYEFAVGQVLYKCDILKQGEEYVAPSSLCRFFTPVEDVIEPSPDSQEESDEELSTTIQKLDFTNSEIKDNIVNLRNNLLNESK